MNWNREEYGVGAKLIFFCFNGMRLISHEIFISIELFGGSKEEEEISMNKISFTEYLETRVFY